MVKDMTTGSPLKLIVSFSVPLLIGNIFQQFYNMVDMMVVGRYLGVDAYAAVGSTGGLSFLVIGFVLGLTGGFSVLVAQKFGANDMEGVRHTTAMAIILSIVSTIILTIAAVLSTDFFLQLMKTEDVIYNDAYNYIIVIFGGIGAAIFYNLISGILRALGDSKTPLYFLIVASLLNVVLDILFIGSFNMGVAGAAWATVIAQVVSGILCLLYMTKKYEILRFKRKDWKIDFPLCKKHMQIALPMAFQFSIIAIGAILLQRAINPLGSDYIAAYTTGNKVEQLCTQPLASLGVTMATYCAQNLGAGRFDRIREGIRKCVFLSLGISAFGSLVLFLFGKQISNIFFTNVTPELLNLSYTYLFISAVFMPSLALLFLYRNALQGMGNSFVPMIAGVSELVMRVLAAFVLAEYLGFVGICLAGPLAWIGAAIPLIILHYKNINQMQQRFGLNN